jgi:hypothetical protein
MVYVEELDSVAAKLGLNPKWKQKARGGFPPHFDASESKPRLAISFGAKGVTPQELVILLRKPR